MEGQFFLVYSTSTSVPVVARCSTMYHDNGTSLTSCVRLHSRPNGFKGKGSTPEGSCAQYPARNFIATGASLSVEGVVGLSAYWIFRVMNYNTD